MQVIVLDGYINFFLELVYFFAILNVIFSSFIHCEGQRNPQPDPTLYRIHAPVFCNDPIIHLADEWKRG